MRAAATGAGRPRAAALTAAVVVLGTLVWLAPDAHPSGPDLDGLDERSALARVAAEDQAEVDRARARAARLRTSAASTPAAAPRNPVALAAPDDAARAEAGFTALHGAAITVTLTDAPPRQRSGPWPPGVRAPVADDLVVHQQDVQAVVNALWSAGAGAMTVMGVRVTSRTAVLCVGNTLRLAGGVYAPPFVIAALGDPARLRAALDTDPGVTLYRQYATAYGLGYTVADAADTDFPAATEPPPRYATPLAAAAD